jgi:excinuclease UvrABC nuclease subunit
MIDIPNSSGIYYFYEGEKLLYVGKSIDLKRRIKQHELNNSQIIDLVFNRIDKIKFVLVDKNKIAAYEKHEIEKLRPVLNHETYGNDIIFDVINEEKERMFQKLKDTI